jgi:hypothetical protein
VNIISGGTFHQAAVDALCEGSDLAVLDSLFTPTMDLQLMIIIYGSAMRTRREASAKIDTQRWQLRSESFRKD